MADSTLPSTQFRRERARSWAELDALLEKIDRRGIRRLTSEELERLPILYRGAISSLSVARAISLDRNVVEYLESLAARAYVQVYTVRQPFWEVVARFVLVRFPGLVRTYRWRMVAAGSILAAGLFVGYGMTMRSPENYYGFVDAALADGRDPSASTESLRDALYERDHVQGELLAAFSSYFFAHNSKISMFCFALGFLPGVAVFYLMFTNGLMLGAFAALYAGRDLGFELWAWLLPHGVTELLAIVLAGGAGLVLGESLVFPGQNGRLENLARKGREAGAIVIGAMGMLLFAALLEGFFRQLVHDVAVRYSVAAATTCFWALYFFAAGRTVRT